HDCVIPEREGYHVILAYWEVADTANAFYQVIDANFDGEFVEPGDPEEPEDPEEPGDGAPTWEADQVYLSGDEVTYEGKTYRAQWRTRGDTPGDSSVWVLVDGRKKPAVSAWGKATIFLKNHITNVYEAISSPTRGNKSELLVSLNSSKTSE